MAKTTTPLLPATQALLRQFAERLRLARLRRRLTAKQVAERAGMAPMTLRNVERGEPGVTMGAYIAVMQVLGVEQDLQLLAGEDFLGRELQDSRLQSTASPKRKLGPISSPPPSSGAPSDVILSSFTGQSTSEKPRKLLAPTEKESHTSDTQGEEGISMEQLVDLLEPYTKSEPRSGKP